MRLHFVVRLPDHSLPCVRVEGWHSQNNCFATNSYASTTFATDPLRPRKARAPTPPRAAKARFRWTGASRLPRSSRIRTILVAALRDHGPRRIPYIATRAPRATRRALPQSPMARCHYLTPGLARKLRSCLCPHQHLRERRRLVQPNNRQLLALHQCQTSDSRHLRSFLSSCNCRMNSVMTTP